MLKNKRENTCLFFASDYHFEMIILPYISKKVEKNKKVIVLTENDLEETMKKVLSRINLNKKKEQKVLNINWKDNDLEKFKEIKELNKNNENATIFIKGKENYIENVRKNIENWVDKQKFNIIECFDLNELKENISDISSNYKNILNTSGISKIEINK